MISNLAHNFVQDLRQSVRLVKRSKLLMLGIVISMGLGVGATASVFSVVDALVFRPMPVPQTDRVVRLANSTPQSSVESFSYPEYQDYAARSQSFSGIATFQNLIVALARNPADSPRVTVALMVSGNFFSTLQLNPVVGRGFLPEEDSVPGRDAVAVISYMAWQRDFGGSTDVVGRDVSINSQSFRIIGVAPKEFVGVDPFVDPEIYIPRMMSQRVFPSTADNNSLTNRSIRSASVLARLKPQTTIEQAKQDVGRIATQLALENPDTNKTVKATILTQFGYRLAGRPGLFTLALVFLTVAFLVLGIACVNISSLILSTIPARTREMAVRVALGAPRRRLLGQLLLESVILSGLGTFVALAIASLSVSYLSSIRIGSDLPLAFHARVDQRVMIFTFAIGFVSALVAGAVPARRCSRNDLNSVLKSSDPRNRPSRMWGRRMLVGAQVAVTAFILVLSVFLLGNLAMAGRQNPGFRVDSLLTIAFDPSIAGYDLQMTHAFYNELLARVRSMQGVKSAAIAQDKPFGVVNSGMTSLTIEGYGLPPNKEFIDVRSSLVGDGYFETLDIPIIRGRAFDRRDGPNAPLTVIINETMAQQFWPHRDPIGLRVNLRRRGPAEVIGIARNSKYGGMEERPLPFLYRSYDQGRETGATLFVETEGAPEALTSPIRIQVRNIAPNMPIFDVRTMRHHFQERGLLEQRFGAQLFILLGGVGLVLGVLGLYGMVAYSVEQRTYEIGIRMAVGASDWQVLRMVMLQGLRSSGIAACIGIIVAFAVQQVTTQTVTYVSRYNPAIYVGVLLLMLFVTGVACYLPARRASRVDPNLILRS